MNVNVLLDYKIMKCFVWIGLFAKNNIPYSPTESLHGEYYGY